MTLEDFKGFVGTQYGLQETGITLRQAVSNFFRIWQRKNSDVDHPLLAYPRDTQADGVKRLLKLFDEYTKLQGFMAAKEEAVRELDLFNAAGRYYDFPEQGTSPRSKTTPSESKTSRPNATKQDSAQD